LTPGINRRRAIGITAAAAGLALLPFGREAHGGTEVVTWHGQALGAPATLQIHHHDRRLAERLVESVVVEAQRLERIFSLHVPDSDLTLLNRQRVRTLPPPELVEVLEICAALWQLSAGMFDPTVQPLWSVYRDHFGKPGADPSGPPAAALEDALARTGFGRVEFGSARVALARPGMSLTLNGIAQGYITDRVVDLLRAGGVESCLVDMGECRAVGERPDGSRWRVGIGDPEEPGHSIDVLEIADRAVATSSPRGFRFDSAGTFSHLIDPKTGRSPSHYRSVTVIAPQAVMADGLSTAFCLMDEPAVASSIAQLKQMEVYVLAGVGNELTRLTSAG
jgi:thiamine biosynthesis lipoprotein